MNFGPNFERNAFRLAIKPLLDISTYFPFKKYIICGHFEASFGTYEQEMAKKMYFCCFLRF